MSAGPLALTPEIDEFRRQFEQLSADADALVAPLSDAQLHWRATPESWSVAQCIEHLNVTARLYLPYLDEAIANAIRRGLYGPGPFRYNWIGRLFVFSLEPPPRLRTRAPAAFTPMPERSAPGDHGGVPRLPGAVHRSPAPGQRHRPRPRARPLARRRTGCACRSARASR